MGDLTTEEYELFRRLLTKIENRHFIIEALFDVLMIKYSGNRTRVARAMGYSVRAIRLKCRLLKSYKYQ
jgi:hypothetical protein